MQERARTTGNRVARQQAMADIQARLEMVEEDLKGASGASRRASGDDLYAQAEDIERLLEELMEGPETPEGLEGARVRGHARRLLRNREPEWTADLEAMYREEEEAAGELADTMETYVLGVRCSVFGVRCSVFGFEPNTEHRTPNTQHISRPGTCMANESKTALIVVDVQKDFCPGGALAVPDGDAVVPVINGLMDRFPEVVTTQDWHPANHVSFKAQGGIWPPHCVAGTPGAELHPDLRTDRITLRIRKADTPAVDAYSGFQGTNLAEELHKRGVTDVAVTGLATDYCVKATALDAKAAGFGVTVYRDACRAVDVQPGDGERALAELTQQGVTVCPTG